MRYLLALLIAMTLGTLDCSAKDKKADKIAKPARTFEQWLAEQNGKKISCKEDARSTVVSSDSFYFWEQKCVHGVYVFTDKTEEQQDLIEEREYRNDQLAKAMITRCLTAKEFAEVVDEGYSLFVHNRQQYREGELQERFYAALLTQQLLRIKCPGEK